ncbi:MFS transporter [Chroococcus sp. FPU101]|uniref:MFS transporter n=1 Tax=Chroococcus sp. FPU101 TaxID=1974212 RepID=UPI001A8E7499|nr:MFS transporter [Chroococcus sp. FPU101]GFE67570.1 Major facilitator superfamily protein [Chroococcus sp. FPU101]
MSELSSTLLLSNRQVWVQAMGRMLFQLAFGLISFYLPILFVNEVGFSATLVGFSISLSSISEIAGHLFSGTVSDMPKFGRKFALSCAAVLGMIVALILTFAQQLWLLMVACIFLGLALGSYWTPASAAVMDFTEPDERPQAFAILGVAEYLGLGTGILGGGILFNLLRETPQLIFVNSAVIFLAFLLLITRAMAPRKHPASDNNTKQGILVALKDKKLLVFILANILFSTYVTFITSVLPLYFTNFVDVTGDTAKSSITSTANLFTWSYILIGVLLQIPLTRFFKSFRRVQVLMIAFVIWASGFFLVWLAGTFAETSGTFAYPVSLAGLAVLLIANVSYKPYSVSIISDLAPPSLRGAYLAVGSQSWAIAYLIGPLLGGWALDQKETIADTFWLFVAATTILGLIILAVFESMTSTVIDQVQPLKS